MEDDNQEKAEKLKELGNDEYKNSNFQAAINHYTEAIGKHFD